LERQEVIAFILANASQPQVFDALENHLIGISQSVVSESLLTCGIIPEVFKHDSTQEKLWAKYCDILMALAFRYLGMDAEVIRTRGDSADVRAKTATYTIVGDGKAFRLSRTAKNQKDFKVSALDDWRKGDTYACLLAPLYQYPVKKSQVYLQAAQKQVTLLSYIHLKFLLDFPSQQSLIALWQAPSKLSPSQEALLYWEHIDQAILTITQKAGEVLRVYKQLEIEAMRHIGSEGIQYWQTVKQSYQQLTRDEAIQQLIKAEKVDEKIAFIEKLITRGDGYYG